MENNFSKNIKYLRQSKRMNQEQLGLALNKDYSTIGKWENGSRSPNVEDTLAVSKYFNVDIADLIFKDLKMEDMFKETRKISKEQFLQEVLEMASKTDLPEEKRKYLESTLEMLVK